MKLYYILTFIFTSTIVVNAQVGIGTTNPMQYLHIAGANSTVRIEGLNSVNNVNNDGINDNVIYVNRNGDLILKPSTPTALINLIGVDLVNPSVQIETPSGSSVDTSLANGSFTTSKSGYVAIEYSLAVGSIHNPDGSSIGDGHPIIISLLVYIDGNLISRDSTPYTSSAIGSNATGYVILDGHHYKNLSAGSHTYEIIGRVYGKSFGFEANFGGTSTFNTLQIIEF